MFRRAVSVADNIDIWVSKTFNLEPKHRLLTLAQDAITKRHLQNTIGKAVGSSNITEPNFVTDQKQWRDTMDKFDKDDTK
tara:strand:- start:49 stop:288 length:240 start_codon:yes stop_codon:yes gene_type:complete